MGHGVINKFKCKFNLITGGVEFKKGETYTAKEVEMCDMENFEAVEVEESAESAPAENTPEEKEGNEGGDKTEAPANEKKSETGGEDNSLE